MEGVSPPYFASLAATAAAAATDRGARAAIPVDLVGYDHSRYLRAARGAANPAQKKALRTLGRRA